MTASGRRAAAMAVTAALFAAACHATDPGHGDRLPPAHDEAPMTDTPKVATCLWFEREAEEAARFYVSLVPDSEITSVSRVAPDGPVMLVTFTLGGAPYQALNGRRDLSFNDTASLSVSTVDQAETDRLWEALLADGGEESQCGWLRDRFGVSWQVVPEALGRLLADPDRAAAGRVMEAMLGMRKIDIAGLEAASRGEGAAGGRR